MKTWKKNVVAAAVLVVVCAGIYINWLYTEDTSQASALTDMLDSDKLLDEDMVVMNSDETNLQAGEGQITNTSADYFAAVRLSRQEARDSAIGLLQEAMAYDTASDGKTAQDLENLIQDALSEAQIESLVIAKGYTDCVAYMTDGGISVAVSAPTEGLQQTDVALITDIIMAQSDYDIDQIRIVEVP
jgi:stage III sporulation protein AH